MILAWLFLSTLIVVLEAYLSRNYYVQISQIQKIIMIKDRFAMFWPFGYFGGFANEHD